MTAPLATGAEFEVRYGRSLTTDEDIRVAALLEDASALVRDVVGTDYLDDDGDVVNVPGAIVVVVIEAARRAFDNPAGLQGETEGNYSWRGATPTGWGSGVFLTFTEKRTVRRAAGRLGVGTVALEGYLPMGQTYLRGTVGNLRAAGDEQLVEDAGGGDPIIHMSQQDLYR